MSALSLQLGLSKNTIRTAYDELRAQGVVESKDRSGFFVAEGGEPRSFDNPVNVPGPEFKKISYIGYVKPKQNNMISLSSVFVDPRILPKEKLSACFKSVLRSPGIPEFNDPQGMPALREKIASRLRDRGMDVEADQSKRSSLSFWIVVIMTLIFDTFRKSWIFGTSTALAC